MRDAALLGARLLLGSYMGIHASQKRFGMFHVDYATQVRTPKASAHWYRAFIEQHKAGR